MPPAIDPSTVRAVVFDIGGVFLIPHHERILPALSEVGIELAPDDAAFHRAHHVGVHAIAEAVRSEELEPVEASARTWEVYDAAYFEAAGVVAEQIGDASEARQAQRRLGVSGVWVYPLDVNIAAFARVMTARPDLERAIVSNNDGSAEQQLLDHAVCQVGPGPLPEVAMVIDSGVIGVSKPDPAIFDPVLDGLRADPGEILYVGDTYQSDVLGARASGLQVVQLDPYDLHHDFDHPRVPDVAALADLLVD
ncbi:MAG: HAD family hydrolase [Actinomycetota bacterium]